MFQSVHLKMEVKDMAVGDKIQHIKLNNIHRKEGNLTTAVSGFDYDYIFILFADKQIVAGI